MEPRAGPEAVALFKYPAFSSTQRSASPTTAQCTHTEVAQFTPPCAPTYVSILLCSLGPTSLPHWGVR